jgi:hypothetical protein
MLEPNFAAYLYCLLTAVVVVFQFCLVAGAPWGEFAMGGKFPGKYPPRMRIITLLMIPILIFVAVIVLVRSGLLLEEYYDFSKTAIWAVVAFSALGAIMNTITPSKKERMLWAPVTIVLLLCASYVALG